jgi:putative ABC transport system ATP-binding protein
MNSLTTQPLKPSFLDENQPVVNIHNLDHFFGTGSLKKQILFQINLTLR